MAVFTENDRLQWVSDEQHVTADMGNGHGLSCVVVKACGHTALIRSLAKTGRWAGWEKWCRVDSLFPQIPADWQSKCDSPQQDR